MRFRRVILRSLGPLLGLSALMTAMAASAEQPNNGPSDVHALARLLRSVADFVAPAVEHASSKHSSIRPSPQSILAFSALAATPLCHSVWMVVSSIPAPEIPRAPRLQPLRC